MKNLFDSIDLANPAQTVIFCAAVFASTNFFILWYTHKRLALQKKLLEFGSQAKGLIVDVSFYSTRNGQFAALKYQFNSQQGETRTGSINLRAKAVEGMQKFQVDASVQILYLPEKPSVNTLQELAQATFDSLVRINRIFDRMLPIGTVLGIAILVCIWRYL